MQFSENSIIRAVRIQQLQKSLPTQKELQLHTAYNKNKKVMKKIAWKVG